MTNESKNITPPTVLMLVGTHCTYCAPMMQILSEQMKVGKLAELRIVNIEITTEVAAELVAELKVKSVSWLQIGPFQLTGSRTKQELLLWLQRASSFDGVTEYLDEVLAEGNLDYAQKFIERYPHALQNVIDLMADPEAKINVRLGIGVIIEALVESDQFKIVIPRLIDYLTNNDARVRGDACHYLSLTGNREYVFYIEKLLLDESEEVREIAQDSLDELSAS